MAKKMLILLDMVAVLEAGGRFGRKRTLDTTLRIAGGPIKIGNEAFPSSILSVRPADSSVPAVRIRLVGLNIRRAPEIHNASTRVEPVPAEGNLIVPVPGRRPLYVRRGK